jgi:hypothetical protein
MDRVELAEKMFSRKVLSEKKFVQLIWYTIVEAIVMVPFDLMSKGLAKKMCLSAEIIISSAEKMSVGILETDSHKSVTQLHDFTRLGTQ